jgi:hypothetical protein
MPSTTFAGLESLDSTFNQSNYDGTDTFIQRRLKTEVPCSF